MKKLLSLFIGLTLLCGGGVSCSDDNTSEEQPVQPTVTLTAGLVTDVTATFTLQAENAESCAYLWSEVPEGTLPETPSPEKILIDGTTASASEAVQITLQELAPLHTYRIYAVALRGSLYSEVATLELTTEETPEPAYETLVEGTSAMGLYYKSFTDESLGNYMIRISDIEYDEYGYAASAGYAFTFDLYGPKSDNVMDARIPEGVYRFDADDTGGSFTCGAGYSTIEQTDDEGYPKGETLSLAGGEIRVTPTDEGYTIVGYVTDEAGMTYKVSYSGPMVIANKTGGIGGNQEVGSTTLFYARYYGQADHNGIGNYYVSLGTTTVDKDDPTTALDNGWMIRLDFWGDVSADDDHAILPEGTYTLSESGAHDMMTICPDDTDVAYYFLTGKTPERTDYMCYGGSVTVTRTGSDYRLDGSLETADGSLVHFLYEGPLDFENRAEKLIGDIDANFPIATCTYLGDQYETGSDNYQIRLASDESESLFVNIELSTEPAASVLDPFIPDGSYRAGESGAYAAGTFEPGYLFSGYLAGTNIGRKDAYGYTETYGLITGGTIDFSRSGDTYTITLNATTSDHFTIKGSYTGKLPIDNTVAGPAIGDVDFQAAYAPSAYYYGQKNDGLGDYYYYLLTFSDIEMGGSYNGIYPINNEAGHCAVLYVYAPTAPTAADPRVAAGTYTLGDERKALIWSTGSEGRAYDAEGNRSTVSFSSGTLTIEHSGSDGYAITFDARTLRGEPFRFTYNGTISIGGMSSLEAAGPVPSSTFLSQLVLTTLRRDAVTRRDLSASKAETILRLPDTAPVHRLQKEPAPKR